MTPRWTTRLNNAAERLARIESKVGDKSIKYVLGAGGFDPDDEGLVSPHHKSGLVGADCSGTVFWAMHVSRIQRGIVEEHLNTDAMIADARTKQRRFARVIDPAPGDIVVYGRYVTEKGVRRPGHCGLIKSVTPGIGAIWGRLQVIHCGSSNWRLGGGAVAQTGGLLFGKRPSIFVRPLSD